MRKILALTLLPLTLILSGCGGSDEQIESNDMSSAPVTKIDPNTPYQASVVGEHASPTDCWTLINGKVYDLTEWIGQHPGGPTPIQGICGRDGSAMFNMQHNVMEGPNSVLRDFQIGIISESSANSEPAPENTDAPTEPVE